MHRAKAESRKALCQMRGYKLNRKRDSNMDIYTRSSLTIFNQITIYNNKSVYYVIILEDLPNILNMETNAMKIDILCVGKVKEAFYRQAIDEYSKRLSRYANLNIIQVNDEKTPDNASDNVIDSILEKEGDRLLKYIPDYSGIGTDTYIISLEIDGKKMTSEELAGQISNLGTNGISHLIFIIGGSLGLHHNVTRTAELHLSFSDMTFPHQLMRVILLEQIYRAYRIINGQPYHK